MKLHEFARAPNPRRVRFFIAEKGIDLETIERPQIDIAAGDNLSEAFRQKNPTGGVPVLELDDGTCISESMAICRYFEALHPEPALLGSSALEQATVEMWNRRMEFDLLLPIAMAFRHTTGHFADRENVFPDYGKDCLGKAVKALDLLDAHLAGHTFVAGDVFTVADITAVVAIDFARVIKFRPDSEQHANVLAWHARISERAAASA